MKIEFIRRSMQKIKEYDWSCAVEIRVDGEKVFSVSDGEPEDANLSRDFNDVYVVPKLLQMAFDAGKNGESFTIEESESDEI